MRIARRAGIYVARKTTTTNPSDARANVAASVGRTPYNKLEIRRVERSAYAQGETNRDHFHSLSDNQTQNISMCCAECHANTDFVSAASNRRGNHSVQADRRQR